MPLTPTEKIWSGGEYVDWRDATVHVLAPSLHYLVRSDLYSAGEAFFTGTAAGLVPVREVDGRVIGDPGPGTLRLQEFDCVIHGGESRYRDRLELAA